jgi:hypothetical protein
MNSTSKPALKIDWATHEAAKFACVNWHYSKSLPASKTVKIGAWENGVFIGVVLFSWGANKNIGSPYFLSLVECCELARVALSKHETPVSKIISIAIKWLKKQSPGLRLIISYADTAKGHHGGIYQATNWIYVGSIMQASMAEHNGKMVHKRTLDSAGIKGYTLRPAELKHKYLMPLDATMREQITPLAKPYPKRTTRMKKQDAGHPPALGGALPTHALQLYKVAQCHSPLNRKPLPTP